MALTSKIDRSHLTCKKGDYCTGKAADLADPMLQARAQEYRRSISAAMRPLAPQDIFSIPRSRGYVATRKYDGEFTLLAFDGDSVISVNPGGTVRTGLPCFAEAEKLLKKAKVKSCLLAGELYVTGDLHGRNRVREVVRALRSPSSAAALKKIAFAAFDMIEYNDASPPPLKDAFKLLTKLFGKGKLVHPVEHAAADKVERIAELFTDWVVGEGSEGLVVRHDKLGWLKIKTRHTLDVAIIGFSEGSENRKGLLHDLLVAVMRDDGTFHELTRVGGGFSGRYR